MTNDPLSTRPIVAPRGTHAKRDRRLAVPPNSRADTGNAATPGPMARASASVYRAAPGRVAVRGPCRRPTGAGSPSAGSRRGPGLAPRSRIGHRRTCDRQAPTRGRFVDPPPRMALPAEATSPRPQARAPQPPSIAHCEGAANTEAPRRPNPFPNRRPYVQSDGAGFPKPPRSDSTTGAPTRSTPPLPAPARPQALPRWAGTKFKAPMADTNRLPELAPPPGSPPEGEGPGEGANPGDAVATRPPWPRPIPCR